jgi:16S rRNA (guanine527-N7)-methyltransferase
MELEKLVEKGLRFFSIPHDKRVVGDLCFYVRELDKWNKRMNLTGLKDSRLVIRELLYDAFFLFSRMTGAGSVLDLGSGSGILGIPVKILDENLVVFSVDKSMKKIQFQRHIRRLIPLKGFDPIHGRAEVIEPLGVDALVVKGFGTIDGILEKGGRHVKSTGRALILKGKIDEPAEQEGFLLDEVIPYRLPESDKDYRLFVYKKTQ